MEKLITSKTLSVEFKQRFSTIQGYMILVEFVNYKINWGWPQDILTQTNLYLLIKKNYENGIILQTK